MCLAIPGRIESVKDSSDDLFREGKVNFNGVLKDIDLTLVPEARPGDYVLVHVGMGISLVDEEEAHKTFEYLEKIGELEELRKDQNQ